MKKNFKGLTSIQLAEEPEFISWIHRGENDEYWLQFIAQNPDMLPVVDEASEILKSINFKKQVVLSTSEKEELLHKILDFESGKTKVKKKHVLFTHWSQVAAVWFVLISVGSWGVYNFTWKENENYEFSNNAGFGNSQLSQLRLSNGETVNLASDHSKIVVDKDNKIIVDEEKTIKVDEKSKDEAYNELIIPFGKKSSLTLSDGTKVWLNAGSKFAFPEKFNGKTRVVFLEGEAYFEVAHNKNMPFIVKTNDINVKVLGTKFNVSAYSKEENCMTTLLEGKVAIKENSGNIFNKEYVMKPNEVATFSKGTKEIEVKMDKDVDKAICWINGFVEFKQEKIGGLLEKLHRFYNVEFELDKNLKRNHNITGKLDLKDSLESVLQILGQISDVKFIKKGEKIYVENN